MTGGSGMTLVEPTDVGLAGPTDVGLADGLVGGGEGEARRTARAWADWQILKRTLS